MVSTALPAHVRWKPSPMLGCGVLATRELPERAITFCLSAADGARRPRPTRSRAPTTRTRVLAAPLARLPPALHLADVAVALRGCGLERHRVLFARATAADRLRDRPGHEGPRWRAHEQESRAGAGCPGESGSRRPRRPRAACARARAGARGRRNPHPPGRGNRGAPLAAQAWAAVARVEAAAGTAGGAHRRRGRARTRRRHRRRRPAATVVLAGRTDLTNLAAAVAVARAWLRRHRRLHLAAGYRVPRPCSSGRRRPTSEGGPGKHRR